MSNTNTIKIKNKVDIEHFVDERLKDPNFTFDFGGEKMNLAKFNELFPSKEKKITMVIEWDNMCQYSAIGVHSILSEKLKNKMPLEPFDAKDYFDRADCPNGIEYIRRKYLKNANKEIFNKLITMYYSDVLKRSPLTTFFSKLTFMKSMLSAVTFVFRYDVNGLADLISDIQKDIFNNQVNCSFQVLKDEESEKRFILNNKFDLYVVPDLGTVYEILLLNDKKNANILSYIRHNGLDPYAYAYYFKMYVENEIAKPNNIEIDFLVENYSDLKHEEKVEEEVKTK